MSPWIDILRRECKARSVTAVARDLGYARTSISLVLNGNYPVEPKRIAARVLAVFGDGVQCPAEGEKITPDACESTRGQPMPTNSAERLRRWTICQSCPFNTQRTTYD